MNLLFRCHTKSTVGKAMKNKNKKLKKKLKNTKNIELSKLQVCHLEKDLLQEKVERAIEDVKTSSKTMKICYQSDIPNRESTSQKALIKHFPDKVTNLNWASLSYPSSDSVLGSGSFGVVSLGFLDTLNVAVAVKKMTSNRKLFILHEAKVMSQLSGHKSFPFFYGVCEEKLVMEYVVLILAIFNKLPG